MMFLSRLLGLKAHSSQIFSPPPLAQMKNQLRMEMLEAREVPATLVWSPVIGGDYLASTPQNWIPAGIAVDNRWSQPLTSADELIFNGYGTFGYDNEIPGDPQADCIITLSEPDQFEGIRLVNGFFGGYTGTVYLQKSLTVGDLELVAEHGAIAQTGTTGNKTLTVTRTLNWTGGTLNSVLGGGTVRLDTATGVIDPGAGKTLKLGSTLELDASQVDFVEGTLQLTGGTGINVNAGSEFNIGGSGEGEEENFGGQPGQPMPERVKAEIKPSPDPFVETVGKRMRIFEGGQAVVYGRLDNKITEVKVELYVENSGKVVIGEKSEVRFAGSDQIEFDGVFRGACYFQSAGQFVIAHGSQAEFDRLAIFRGGSIKTTTWQTTPEGTMKVIGDAKLIGNEIISYADIFILAGKEGLFGSFKVEGNLDLRNGTLYLRLDGRTPNNMNSDQSTELNVSKTLTVDTGTNAAPRVKIRVSVDGLAGAAVAAGRTWKKVINAGTKIQLQNNGTVAPLMSNTGYKVVEQVVQVGDNRIVQEWEITKE